MIYDFSERALNLTPSLIREIDAYAATNPDFITLADGNPAYESYPVEILKELNSEVYDRNSKEALLYGPFGGLEKLAEQVMRRLEKEKGINPTNNRVFMLPGAQMGLFMMPLLFCNEGDVVLTEEISYAHAIEAVRGFKGKVVGVKTDENGIDIESLEEKLSTTERVKYIYLVPNFGNPTGITIPLERRKAIYDLAVKYNVLIMEDDPYGDLRYAGKPLPAIKSFDTDGRVVYNGSFSKILAAGIRVGYMCCSEEIWAKAYAAKGNIDAGSNMTAQFIVSYFLEKYDIDKLLENTRKIYSAKWKLMGELLNKNLPGSCRISKPEGGMFYWVTMPDDADFDAIYNQALENGVGIVPSKAFASDLDHAGKSFRLCFSCSTLGQIEEGCKRFYNAVNKFCK